MGSFSDHLQRQLDALTEPHPVRSLPRARREPIYKGRGACEPDHKVVSLVDGEGFSFLGQPHRLDLTDTGSVKFDRDGYGHWLRLPRGAGRDEISSLYAREGVAWLTGEDRAPHVRGTEIRLGLAGVRYEARGLGTPARCYPSRRLVVLHWATFSFDPILIGYVITGQLVHLAAGSTRRDRRWWERMNGFYPPSAGDTEDRLSAAWARTWVGECGTG